MTRPLTTCCRKTVMCVTNSTSYCDIRLVRCDSLWLATVEHQHRDWLLRIAAGNDRHRSGNALPVLQRSEALGEGIALVGERVRRAGRLGLFDQMLHQEQQIVGLGRKLRRRAAAVAALEGLDERLHARIG